MTSRAADPVPRHFLAVMCRSLLSMLFISFSSDPDLTSDLASMLFTYLHLATTPLDASRPWRLLVARGRCDRTGP